MGMQQQVILHDVFRATKKKLFEQAYLIQTLNGNAPLI